ncbi:MAG: NAD(+)/NADH kinase [Pirellulales bacterium]|nr:NAD(+)/NADH kinase [Pirellulales bacterium]
MAFQSSSNTVAVQRPSVLMLANGDHPEIRERAARLRPILEKHVDVVALVDNLAAELPAEQVDFAVVFGGDGSMLRAAHCMGYQQIPVLGVNLGHLGFLADIQPEQLDQVLPCLVAGDYRVVRHLMFECDVQRGGTEMLSVLGLNEVAVLAGAPFAIMDVQLYVDAELVTTYSCDGLIVSTPVGSTAHSLSAGGPILRKDLQALVISPISPHTLTNRPVVDSADREYELVVPAPHEGTSLVIDGKVVGSVTAEDRIRIRRATAQFQLIEVRGHGYYRTLREKLGWGGRLKGTDVSS